MTWSYNGYRLFQKCTRQWYYKNIVASAVSSDPYRHEMYILSKLKTLDAWRGDVVDYMISVVISSKIRNDKELSADSLVWAANQKFDEQLEYARRKAYRRADVPPSEYNEYAAIFEYDRDEIIPQADLNRARKDVETAIRNFLRNEIIIEQLMDAKKIVTQRTLIHPFSRYKVKGRPDLIAFYDDEPPHIFDWKVHTFATKAYDDQLLCYAFSLSEVQPHKDFPLDYKQFNVLDYKLTEFQLLLDEVREYEVTQEELDHTTDTIASGLLNMYQLGANRKYKDTLPADFPTTDDVEKCNNCPYTLICKQHEDEIRNKHLSN